MKAHLRSGRRGLAAATATVLLGCGQLIPAPAAEAAELHNVTYTAKVDAWASGNVVTFMINDTQTTSADMGSFGEPFTANAVLADPSKAGMVIRLRWPTAANVHCEIQVDDLVAVKSDRFITTWANSDDPRNGAMLCGALISSMA